MNTHECPATKTCNKCQEAKPIGCFSKGRNQCKSCRCNIEKRRMADPEYRDKALERKRAHHSENKGRMNKISREYYMANRERMIEDQLARDAKRYDEKLAYERSRYAEKADEIKSVQREWRQSNKARIVARDIRRQRALENATPSWANLQKMERFYQEAKRLTKETGIPHHVDHIIPLQGKTVSGLHVESNLQVITATKNLRKSNKFG